jgi:hypothetical protein
VRMPRVRFTVRRMMLVILVVAIAVGGWIEAGRYRLWLRRRGSEYSRLAFRHSGYASNYRRQALSSEKIAESFRDMARLAPGSASESRQVEKDHLDKAARLRSLADKEDKLANKWQLARQRPWLPVEPDPPAPE